ASRAAPQVEDARGRLTLERVAAEHGSGRGEAVPDVTVESHAVASLAATQVAGVHADSRIDVRLQPDATRRRPGGWTHTGAGRSPCRPCPGSSSRRPPGDATRDPRPAGGNRRGEGTWHARYLGIFTVCK